MTATLEGDVLLIGTALSTRENAVEEIVLHTKVVLYVFYMIVNLLLLDISYKKLHRFKLKEQPAID